MEISPQQQIFEQIRKSKKILIALPQNLTADSLASGLALKLFLNKQEKDVLLASSRKVARGFGVLTRLRRRGKIRYPGLKQKFGH